MFLSDLIFSSHYWVDCFTLLARRMRFKCSKKNYKEFNLGDNKQVNVMDRNSIKTIY